MRFRIKLILIGLLFTMRIVNATENRIIHVLNFEEFEPYLHFNDDTVYVINFWATWCVPCRKELPEFEKFHIDNKGEKIRVILVSLDALSRVESTLLPFLDKNNIEAKVLLLNDPDHNAWIDKVDPSWSGSLPATMIYKNSEKQFFEKELNYEIIKKTVTELSNLNL